MDYVYVYGFLRQIITYFPFPIDNKHWNKYTHHICFSYKTCFPLGFGVGNFCVGYLAINLVGYKTKPSWI